MSITYANSELQFESAGADARIVLDPLPWCSDLVATEGRMTTLKEEIRICPVCEFRFAVTAVHSCGSHGADSDFRPHFWGSDPLDDPSEEHLIYEEDTEDDLT